MSDNKKKGIVLNRMYAGDYLSTNLGHEVINMFQADDTNHYLYLNPRGNFTARGKDMDTMLLVRGIGDRRVEIIGMAKNLQCIESACCTLPRDIGKIDTKVRNKQIDLEIKYDRIPIFEIFGSNGQQSVYVSYYCEEGKFFIPSKNKRLILEFKNTDKPHSEGGGCQKNNQKKTANLGGDTEYIRTIENHNFSSQMLHQFIDTEEDLDRLKELCNNNALWVEDNVKISDVDTSDYGERRISLFDICQIQNDENRFSNALSYFILQYPELWQRLLQSILKEEDLDEIQSVTREEDAKVKNKKNTDEVESASKEEDAKVDNDNWEDKTGGRIDLLLRTKKYYIIIENKIDSEIIEDHKVKKQPSEVKTQLSRYYNYVKYLKKEQIEKLQEEESKIKNQINTRWENLKKLKNKNGERGKRWVTEIVDYIQELINIKQEIKDKRIIGIVLTPNYNLQKEKLLKVDDENSFKSVTYKEIYEWLKDNAQAKLDGDVNFKDFHNAMKQHTYEYKSEALYEDMKEKFIRRIQVCKAQKQHIK